MPLFFIVLLGLIIGSAINAFVYRLHAKDLRGFLTGRSICPSCRHPLGFLDLIPVASFIELRGHCRYCAKKISPHYPIVEITTAFTFGLVTYVLGIADIPHLIIALVFATTLIILATYDARYGEIPDEVSLPAIGLALVAGVAGFTSVSWQASLLGLIVGGSFFFVLVLMSGGRWMGGGDIRLGALLGALLGWQSALLAIFLASAIGATAGISMIAAEHLITRKRAKKLALTSSIPFAPALALGGLIGLLWGQQLIAWYLGNYVPTI